MNRRLPRSLRPALALAALVAITAASPVAANEEDPFDGAVFPPELVLRHTLEIDLDAEQIEAIKRAIGEAQPVFLDKQLDLQAELGRLRRLLAPPRVDEPAVLEQLDHILALERDVKRAQVALLVRIKNLLDAEQQRRLDELRQQRR